MIYRCVILRFVDNLIHRERSPFPKGKAKKNSDFSVKIKKTVRITASKEVSNKIHGEILAFPLGKGDRRNGG